MIEVRIWRCLYYLVNHRDSTRDIILCNTMYNAVAPAIPTLSSTLLLPLTNVLLTTCL